MENKLTKCPTCGSLCSIGGDNEEGTQYFVPQKTELTEKIEKLSDTLKIFAAALSLASINADEPTKKSYLAWVEEIQNILAGAGILEKLKDKTLNLVKLTPELFDDLELHCSCCKKCDYLKSPDKNCPFGQTLLKIKESE